MGTWTRSALGTAFVMGAVWLWSEQAGVFSHQTALALHDLSDILPADDPPPPTGRRGRRRERERNRT